MTYASPKEIAVKIRKLLATEGIPARSVSVRSDGNSVDVTIKDAAVGSDKIRAIAGQFEKIDRCPASGEILSGGNTYVSTKHDWQLVAVVEKYVAGMFAAEITAKGWGVWNGYQIAREDGGRWTAIKTGDTGSVLDSRCWDMAAAVSRVTQEALRSGVVMV